MSDSQIEYRDRWTEASVRWAPNSPVTVRSKVYHIQSDRYWRNAKNHEYNAATGLVDRSGNTEIAHDQTQSGNTTDATFSGKLFGNDNQVSVGFDVNTSSFQHSNNTYAGSSGSVDLYNPMPSFYNSTIPFIP